MVKKYTISFQKATAPITELVTKFGGQPVWLEEPQWPVSRLYGTPMKFVCQIVLAAELFGSLPTRMAYLFMTEDVGSGLFPETWSPDGGENAVILQPSGSVPSRGRDTEQRRTGPTLFRRAGSERAACEFAVDLIPGEDPDVFEVPDVVELDEAGNLGDQDRATWERYLHNLFEAKIGGTLVPQDNDARPRPGPGNWRLLLQLAEGHLPFDINFGTDGVGYAFLSADGREGRFVHQRP